uniref:C2H2-type domain-containing protein n=1 Tax=Glossina brevipalpis TaxID=37001 RepID=A0A1A9WXS5_9MUSC
MDSLRLAVSSRILKAMEILMKVKCPSSSTSGDSGHSTLKIVDHHHQLHQQYNSSGSANVKTAHQIQQNLMPSASTFISGNNNSDYSLTSSCSDCSLGYCCNMSSCCVTSPPPPLRTQIPPAPHPAPPTSLLPQLSHFPTEENTSYEYEEPEENFVSIDDVKIKNFLLKIGQKKQQLQQETHIQNTPRPVKEPRITKIFSTTSDGITPARPVVYEIIELDDEEERERLKRIKQQAEKWQANRRIPSHSDISLAVRQTKSLDISLIPKYPDNAANVTSMKAKLKNTKTDTSKQKIVAEIDLLDSSSNSTNNDVYNDDDDSLPLVASAVSCELQCDDDDSSDNERLQNRMYTNKVRTLERKNGTDEIVVLGSDDETNDQEQDNHLLVRWSDYSDQRERVFFECFLCGKKVQSSYNLRRHMMIHTGERPFSCDLCDRKFREFSDLKKHRRRHANEANFMCMVCHEYPPIENDPTRCINCCTQSKNAVIMAAMRSSDSNSPPEKSSQSAINTRLTTPAPIKTSPSRNFTPNSTVSSCTPSPALTQSPNMIDSQAGVNPPNNVVQEAQHLLDNIPAVHRPGYNQLGMITRKEFPCPLCHRAFGSRHNLKRHYMIHTGEKPFSCSQCRKPFREYSTLKKHMVTHQRDRWYKCSRCPQKFRDFLQYTEHRNSHPIEIDDNDNETPFVSSGASPCKKARTIRDDSNEEDSSSDEWLECCECGQRFNEIDSYNEHLKQHDAKAHLYECYICKQHCKNRDDLDAHLDAHEEETS